jgi:two-component system, sporulation sensor kinase E
LNTSLQQYIDLLNTTDQMQKKLVPAELQKENDLFFVNHRYSIFDTQGRYLYVSAFASQSLGLTSEQMIGKHWSELGLPEALTSGMKEAIRIIIETPKKVEIGGEYTGITLPQYFYQIFFPLCEAGKVVAIGNLTVDMTALRMTEDHLRVSRENQQQSEKSLRQSEAKFDTAFYANLNPMTITSTGNGPYLDVNEAFSELVGYSREELLDGIERTEIWQDVEQRQKAEDGLNHSEDLKDQELTATTKLGQTRDVVTSSVYIGSDEPRNIMTSMSDVTERNALRSDITRLDRLNLIGEMAASISHEIRNPLTTVRGYLQMIGKKDTQFKNQFAIMIDELDRANDIITEFLSLAKNRHIERSNQKLNDIIESIRPLMEADAVSQGKSIITELSEDLPWSCLDDKEIRQLILNLVRNGLEAIEPGKRVYIRTYVEENKVVLAVHDEGKGIPPHILANLGMPFNTSKENGTGLGLSVCYRIVERQEAVMKVYTGLDGTDFIISFQPVIGIEPNS